MGINLELIFDKEKLSAAARKQQRKERRVSIKRRKKTKLNRYCFRLMRFRTKELPLPRQRLRAIQVLAKYKYKHPDTAAQFLVRQAFNRKKFYLLKLDNCYVCNEAAVHRHHLVLIKNGGTNIKDNLVGLCESCHMAVHPWMARVQELQELDERLSYLLAK